ncbi:MAG: transposase [Burkholderiales bacterium]
MPQHLVVRGNNRCVMFRDDADRLDFLRFLADALEACACDLHAYVLMTNHVHLLATGHRQGELSELVQRVGRKYARLVNLRWGRTGALFEGRFRSSLVDSDAYLLTCMRYIELNPVRAGMARHPSAYPWSSYRTNATGEPELPIVAHETYRQLGATAVSRGEQYRGLVESGVSDPDLERIRTSVRKCRVLGSESFCAGISARLDRRTAPAPRGRPCGKGDRSENEPDPN